MQAVFLMACLALAAYLWTAPMRAERGLQTATLEQLIETAKREPENANALYFLGLRYEQLGNPMAAIGSYKKAAEKDGDHEKAWLGWARATAAVGNTQEAFSVLSVFAKAHPGNAPAHLALSAFYRDQDAMKRAYEEAKKASELDSKSADAWYQVGSAALKLKMYAEAEAALRRAIALAPKDWAAPFALAQALLAAKRDTEALVSFQQAANLAPTEGAPLREIGRSELASADNDAAFQKALDTLLKATRLSPQDPMVYLLLGQVYQKQGKWQEAKAALEQSAVLDPQQPTAFFELAKVYTELGDMVNAGKARQLHVEREASRNEIHNLLSQIYQDNADAGKSNELRLQLARIYVKHGDVGLALREYRHLAARVPGDKIVQQELAALQKSVPQAAPVAGTMLPASGIVPVSIATLIQDGNALLKQQNYAGAKSVFARVLLQDGRSGQGFLGLGLALIGEGNEEDAFRAFQRALQADPNLDDAQFNLAKLYLKIGISDETIRRMQSIIKTNSKNANYYNLLGQAYQKVDVRPEAEEAFRQAVANAPEDVDYLVNLACAEQKNQHFDQSEAHFREAARRQPDNGQMLAFFGGLLSELGQSSHDERRLDEAEKILKRSLELTPSNPNALFNLGNLYIAHNRPKEAIVCLRALLQQRSDLFSIWYRLAVAYERSGDKKQAEICRKKAQKLSEYFNRKIGIEQLAREQQKDPALRVKLARVYAEGGDYVRALNQYQVAIALDPKNAAVKTEFEALTARLKKSGQLPRMDFFNGEVFTTDKKPVDTQTPNTVTR